MGAQSVYTDAVQVDAVDICRVDAEPGLQLLNIQVDIF